MTLRDRRLFLRLAGAAALSATAAGCAREDAQVALDHSAHDHDSEGGIGGTGVFGPVTGYGSIIAAGRRIALPDGLSAQTAFGALPAAEIPLGSVVALVASEDAEGGLTAQAVEVVTALAGPVTRPPDGRGAFEVMGVEVRTTRPVRVSGPDGAPQALSDLTVADRVAVSGLWRRGDLIATRIERLAGDGPDVASGLLFPGGDRGPRIEGLRLSDEPDENFGFVVARGRWGGGLGFVASEIDRRGLDPFPARTRRAVVEAYMARDPVGQGHHMAGVGLPRDRGSDTPVLLGVRARFEGGLDDRNFRVERAEPL